MEENITYQPFVPHRRLVRAVGIGKWWRCLVCIGWGFTRV